MVLAEGYEYIQLNGLVRQKDNRNIKLKAEKAKTETDRKEDLRVKLKTMSMILRYEAIQVLCPLGMGPPVAHHLQNLL